MPVKHSVCVCVCSVASIVSKSLWPCGLSPTRLLCPWGFSRQEYWSGFPCPPPGYPPHPRIKPAFLLIPALSGRFFTTSTTWGVKVKVKSLSCVWLFRPRDCNLPRASVHGIFQARVLEWVAICFSRGSSQLRDQTWVSCFVGRHFTVWATREGTWGVAVVKLRLLKRKWSTFSCCLLCPLFVREEED